MKIQILGKGCTKCGLLAEAAEKAARDLGLDYQIEKITDIERITAFGVMLTPALAVDGVVKCSGKVPSASQIRAMLAGDLPA